MADALTVVCLNLNNCYERGEEYVEKLARGVRRNLHQPYRFVCLNDQRDAPWHEIEYVRVNTTLPGWWAKVGLFQPGLFPGRNLYLDLDVVVHDDLAPLVSLLDQHPGVWALDDFEFPLSKLRCDYPERLRDKVLRIVGPHGGTCNSSVLLWRGDAGRQAWSEFSPAAVDGLAGDQNWLTKALWPDHLRLIPPGYAASYKQGGCGGLLVYHGEPRPHTVSSPWMSKHWS